MSNTSKDQEFYSLADAFIALANQQAETVEQGKVSAAFLYAAARFNTYIVAASSPSAKEMNSNKDASTAYFVDEYKKMLAEHFTDYLDNFDTYLKAKNKSLN